MATGTFVLQAPTLICNVGIPGSGKSTVGNSLATLCGINLRDIDDDARTPNFGKPPDNDGTDPQVKLVDGYEMAGAYDILFGFMQGYLRARRSLITTCTLSNKQYGQVRLLSMFNDLKYKNPDLRLRIIWCKPQLTDEELDVRMAARMASGYTGATRTADRVRQLERAFQPIELPHLALNSGGANMAQDSINEALGYILDHQPHDGDLVFLPYPLPT